MPDEKLPFLFIIRFIPNFVSMKRKVSAANLSIAITFLLILLSFGFGYRSYSQAEQRVVSDLNQALQRTVLQHKGLWLNADTIQTYAKLQEVMGTPVSVSGFHRAFTEALSITGLKDVSTLSLHILKKNAPATVFNEIPAGCLASDTLVWLSTTADASGLTLSMSRICPLLSYHAVQLIQADNSGNIAIGRPAVGRIHLFLFPSAHKD